MSKHGIHSTTDMRINKIYGSEFSPTHICVFLDAFLRCMIFPACCIIYVFTFHTTYGTTEGIGQ